MNARFRVINGFSGLFALGGVAAVVLMFRLMYLAVWTVGPDSGRYGGTALIAFIIAIVCFVVAGFLFAAADDIKRRLFREAVDEAKVKILAEREVKEDDVRLARVDPYRYGLGR